MDQDVAAKEQPRYIKLNERDNVAIVVNDFGLPAGSRFASGLTLRAFVPQGHKTALVDIAQDAPIIRYGEIIGYALSPISAGEWVDEARIRMPEAPALDKLEISTAVPAPLPPLEGFTFEGYRNPDGSVGTKNILGISSSVQCVKGTMEYAVKRIRAELLPKYPNVDDVVPLTHAYGCGVAITAPDAVVPIRTLQNLALNPNFGGEILVVGLGCEKLAPERLVPEGVSDAIVRMQDEAFDGFGAIVDAIMTQAEARLKVLNTRKRETCPASDLVIGLQCGGSDAFSGVTANPAVGFAADLLVRAGATVMFSEVTEVRDAIQLLTRRAINEDVGRALVREMAWYDSYLARGGADRSANTTPGNKKGGLANIVEKSLGSIVKSGSSAITGVLSPGEKATQKGMLFAATPASDFICGTLQLASGMTLQVFTTGRGTPYGLAAAPVIKVATRSELARRWKDLIDFDSGSIATGEKTIEECGWDLFRLILDVASGRTKPWSDRWGIHNDLTLFNPAPVT
ncbi:MULTISPECIES: galactarate dehydratase [Bradyrhizobium]|uniref:Galactarate dehydratase n=1 Tax=Bradyrhizobium arachidis TaxID=858423 RepID=A0AAE7NSV3_9BRAD|nr:MULTISPECIES: galactarate dehydratase [Bradyrhizobium]QOG17296.1 galactarate dehydratase [Bradyrhizobium sp. SEMIA]QOZ70517.1 galactarate dehydratase [Bradyrhizobium arachidis]UFW46957.1 galactarate dehydratase [Bradyrhizobium arachidis]SFU61574.1 galactarate dehydratase [Bradyrhizobium arachidis]